MKSDELTLLVFKDNYSSRSFKVPLKWISRIGVLLVAGIVILAISIFVATKYYNIALRSDPTRILNLERQLKELEASYLSLKTTTETPTEPSATPSVGGAQATLFTALPAGSKPVYSNALPTVSISDPQVQWIGKILDLRFDLQYVKRDSGNQQGRIVILARGPDLFMVYPKGALNVGDSKFLIRPKKGEYFSVSRFRKSKAEFGPVPYPSSIKLLDILILNKQGDLIARRTLKVPRE